MMFLQRSLNPKLQTMPWQCLTDTLFKEAVVTFVLVP